ncbi:TIGR04283 family arsenosugar biosynthesis glycosyltransferase [Winogradskyella echinorum]|uniref:TIGR04283 family arsenosugar biosynthesis glycosyltransferase n=1 Tax=Winogradskyella echinorum TaxID=538189 RepID=A0ABR6XXV0_9FLAO|nr:TIGR04283 family arsenosugar biosynthesis glycosyltransferase [Winogradskyella echinorum]MBC3845291.1 TIGR04283 family arsenosugar biosynthesis glycosyltransferase [Winogradskyella echinorum]MBC5749639.1 TIGR04283 family arsenosugar biosynthesis glycosyltransferase [Winogradskyella echinorum]
MKHQISIIIPVLNEAKTIKDVLFHLIDNASLASISEIIVVDGGSTDGTQKIVSGFVTSSDSEQSEELYREAYLKVLDTKFQKRNFTRTDIKLFSSEKGRAKQMNLGAKHAKGEILYFLHADSFPPQRYDTLIINEVKKGNNAGCFRMQFDSNHWWLRLASWLTQFSWRACRGGDQSQFITRALFDEIGGYDEHYAIYEDNILINELYNRNEFVVINKKLTTSARMYRKHGIWKLQYLYWSIYVRKWFGASADDLCAYYRKHLC